MNQLHFLVYQYEVVIVYFSERYEKQQLISFGCSSFSKEYTRVY